MCALNTTYEYRGLMALYWDLLRGDTRKWPDRAFFRWVIRKSGQPVLDVGCGTGRLLLEYLGRGIAIEGVDVSPEMLVLCRRKAEERGLNPVLYEGAMETLDLPQRYRTILVPSSSFQLVTDPDLARESLRRFWKHLQPGGTLALPVMDLDKEDHTGEWTLAAESLDEQAGVQVRRWARTTYDPTTRLESTEDRYELVRDGVVVKTEHHSRSPATRSYTLAEAIAILRETGYTAIRAYSGFSSRPATIADRLFCLLAERPWV